MKTAYTTLQVAEHACQEVIDAAWKALLKKYHPDLNPTVDPRIAQILNKAHDLLSDPEARQTYDAQLRAYREQQAQREVHTESGMGGMYGGVQYIIYTGGGHNSGSSNTSW